jgi:hypothetical protein
MPEALWATSRRPSAARSHSELLDLQLSNRLNRVHLLGRHPHSRSHGRCRQGRSIAVLADKADEQSTGRERERSATQRAKHGAFYNQQRERQSILTNFLRGSCRSTRQTKRPPSHPDGRSIAQFEPLYPQSPTQSARGRSPSLRMMDAKSRTSGARLIGEPIGYCRKLGRLFFAR